MTKFQNLHNTPLFGNYSDPFADRRGTESVHPNNPICSRSLQLPEQFAHNSIHFAWLGHSSVFLHMGGLNILIDPVFSNYVSPLPFAGPRRFPGVCTKPSDLPEIDLVLITHSHYDHLDKATLQALDGQTAQYIVPAGVNRILHRFGIDEKKITTMKWYDETTAEGLSIVCLPTQHGSARTPFDSGRTLWCSYLLNADGFTVFDTGDGGYNDHFADIHSRYGDVDLAIMECGQYSVRWHGVHMFPEESVQAAMDLGAKLAIPVHWGTYPLSDHPWGDPPKRFARRAQELGVNFHIPKINEVITLRE